MRFFLLFLGILFLGLTAAGDRAAANQVVYDSGGRRDPLEPLIGPDGVARISFNTTGMTIEGIIFDPSGESLVLINGEFFKVGEQVNNAQVTAIHNDRVVLDQEGEERVLWLIENNQELEEKSFE